MSYRAIISLIDDSSAGRPTRDFLTILGGDWLEGEVFSHQALHAKEFEAGVGLMGTLAHERIFPGDDARADYLTTYADQRWEVKYSPDSDHPEFTRVSIRGYDAANTEIFMRQVSFHLG